MTTQVLLETNLPANFDGTLTVENHFSFTDARQCKFTWQLRRFIPPDRMDDNDDAIALLESAVAAAPSFAAAHAELARAYAIRHFFFFPDDAALEGRSRAEAETALRLNPESSDAHLARGGAAILTTHQEVTIAARARFAIALGD